MKADNVFCSFYEGDFKLLAETLKEQVGNTAEIGDIVQLSRLLSYYGAVNVFLGNDFIVSTILKQIEMEYPHSENDPRIKASYARFLALYNSFIGKYEEASQYYSEARLLYRETDWYFDESILLLESICWYYINKGEEREIDSVLRRLEVLNQYIDGYLNKDIFILKSISRVNNILTVKEPQTIDKLELEDLSIPVKILICFILLQSSIKEVNQQTLIYPYKTLKYILDIKKQDYPIIQLLNEMLNLADSICSKKCTSVEAMFNNIMVKAEIPQLSFLKEQLADLKLYLDDKKQFKVELKAIPEDYTHISKKIYIKLFDKCFLYSDDVIFNINSFKTRTGNELLLYLLTSNNLQIPKDVLIELFYPDEDPEKAYNRLYVNIHRLNKLLKKYFCFIDEFIYIKQGIVCINADIIEDIDTQRYRKLLSVANQLWYNDKDAAIELMQKAVGIYSINIAPGFYYLDWLEDYRLSLKLMQLKALTRTFQYYQGKNDLKACSEAFYSLVELDPLNEEYYIEYISLILKDGRSVEAMNLYQQYQTRLKKELGLAPSLKLKSQLF